MTTYTCFILTKPRNRIYTILRNVYVKYYNCTSLKGEIDFYAVRLKKLIVKIPLSYINCEQYCHLCKLNIRESMNCCFNTRFFFYIIYELFETMKMNMKNNWNEDSSRQDLSIYKIDYLYNWIESIKPFLNEDIPLKEIEDKNLRKRIINEFFIALKIIENAYNLGVELCYNF